MQRKQWQREKVSYPRVANSVESSVLGETNVWNQGSSKLSVVGRGGYQLKLCPAISCNTSV